MKKPKNAKETKVFLSEDEDVKLIKASKLTCQSKVEYCTFIIKEKLKHIKL